MTAGIYMITFTPSGKRYIGKSKDIPNRWKQHIDAFVKGTHSKKMQEEHSKSTDMAFAVILECHEDHIDLLEAYFIDRLKPELNFQNPTNKYDWGQVTPEFLKLSTMEHFEKLNWAAGRLEELRDKIQELESENYSLLHGSELGKQLVVAEEHIEILVAKLTKWETAPWWKRIFM